MPMRRIGYRDPETGKVLVFLANNFTVLALTITQLYRGRWQIELFFKWIKQHLRIKAFYGTSPNAVRVQIWTANVATAQQTVTACRLILENTNYRQHPHCPQRTTSPGCLWHEGQTTHK